MTEPGKKDPLDSTDHLKDWGYTASACFKCGIHNSKIDGLLMQCGKCKKAYYCSMKCFNEDLVEHQKFCTTTEISSEPKGRRYADLTRKVAEKVEEEPEPESEPEPEPESESDHGSLACSETDEGLHESDENLLDVSSSADDEELLDLESVGEDQEPEESEEPEEEQNEEDEAEATRRLKIGTGVIHSSPVHKKESVNLRAAEISPTANYEWEKPEWATNSPLKSTAKGKVVVAGGTLSNPVTNAAVLIEKGEVQWDKPEWTKKSLKETGKAEQVKQGNLAKPVTMAATLIESGEVQWEKPEWTKEKKLRDTKNKPAELSPAGVSKPPVVLTEDVDQPAEVSPEVGDEPSEASPEGVDELSEASTEVVDEAPEASTEVVDEAPEVLPEAVGIQ